MWSLFHEKFARPLGNGLVSYSMCHKEVWLHRWRTWGSSCALNTGLKTRERWNYQTHPTPSLVGIPTRNQWPQFFRTTFVRRQRPYLSLFYFPKGKQLSWACPHLTLLQWDFPYAPYPALHAQPPHLSTPPPHPWWYIVTRDELTWTLHHYPKSMVCITVNSCCCTFYGCGQIYNTMYLPLSYHMKQFHSPEIPLCTSVLPSTPSSTLFPSCLSSPSYLNFPSPGISLLVQWLGLQAPNTAGPDSILGQGTRSHIPQVRPSTAKQTKMNFPAPLRPLLAPPAFLTPFPPSPYPELPPLDSSVILISLNHTPS